MKIENNQPRESTGVIYSFSIVYVGFGHMADRAPYALIQIEKPKKVIEMGLIYDKSSLDRLHIGAKLYYVTEDDSGTIYSVK
ncbi:MAG: hypothetical protein JJT78_11460 [Leptospira sp.]|nr:hypothetical protein [Leptospira sp.]